MLSTLLRHPAGSSVERDVSVKANVSQLFEDRGELDFLSGNSNLWEALRGMWNELEAREQFLSIQVEGAFNNA
jgi:hypothetical protein